MVLPLSLSPSPPGFFSTYWERKMTTATKRALPLAAVAPLVLLAFAALLSFSYRYAKTLPLSTSARRTVIVMHAFATEGIQVLLIVNMLLHVALMVAMLNSCLGGCCRFEDVGSTVQSVLVVLFVLAMDIIGIFAVDFVEAWIVLKRFAHPYQWQCLILTRSLLFRQKQPVAYWSMRARAHSEPVRKTRGIVEAQQEWGKRRTLTLLSYLDLTYGLQRPDSAPCKDTTTTSSSTKVQGIPCDTNKAPGYEEITIDNSQIILHVKWRRWSTGSYDFEMFSRDSCSQMSSNSPVCKSRNARKLTTNWINITDHQPRQYGS